VVSLINKIKLRGNSCEEVLSINKQVSIMHALMTAPQYCAALSPMNGSNKDIDKDVAFGNARNYSYGTFLENMRPLDECRTASE